MASTEFGSADAFMGKTVPKYREWAMSGFSGRSLDRAPRHHRNQMRAIFGTAVQVAVQSFGRHRRPIERLQRETLLQRFPKSGHANPAIAARAGDGDAHIRWTFGDEHADQRIARGLVAEFDVGCLLWDWKHHLRDNLVALKRGREHPLKEFFRLEAALVGDDGRVHCKYGRRIIGGRVV